MGSAAWPACSDDGLQSELQTQPEHKEKEGSARVWPYQDILDHRNMDVLNIDVVFKHLIWSLRTVLFSLKTSKCSLKHQMGI